MTFNVHSKTSNNDDDSDKNTMFNVSWLYSIPPVFESKFFRKLVITNEPFEEICDSLMACICCNKTEISSFRLNIINKKLT